MKYADGEEFKKANFIIMIYYRYLHNNHEQTNTRTQLLCSKFIIGGFKVQCEDLKRLHTLKQRQADRHTCNHITVSIVKRRFKLYLTANCNTISENSD